MGERITWTVYGRQYSGTVVRVVTDDALYRIGDRIVRVDNPQYPNQTVVVPSEE